MSTPSRPNRLIYEKSPYLRQHAHNPVDWRPWNDATLAEARNLDRPIFLSIGYATCHWCHVMERDSFESQAVAALLNAHFVPVKVDREERPDLDNFYMNACTMMNGRGGWPLTIIATPDGRPFFAATYIPRESRSGHLGMLDLLPKVAELWRTSRAKLESASDSVIGGLRTMINDAAARSGGEIGQGSLHAAEALFTKAYDAVNGGFGTAPKFPSPHNLIFLLRRAHSADRPHLRDMAVHTLKAMRLGGLWDHVGFGFHRYSTDAGWKLPHFEKMLYDQATMLLAYAEAYAITGDAFFGRVARDIVTYVLRDLRSPEGGFYSAEDADSEGEEGRFYVWTETELQDVLGCDAAALVGKLFGCEPGGNYEDEASGRRTGANVLRLPAELDRIAQIMSVETGALRADLERIRQQLFAARAGRTHPMKDTKIIAEWNGLMIAALARAARVLCDPVPLEAAEAAARFVLTRMRAPDGRLLRRHCDGESGVAATSGDYAGMVFGLIELHQATWMAEYLREALELNAALPVLFGDPDRGGYNLAQTDTADLIMHTREAYDGAMPSSNSVALHNLVRLARLTGESGPTTEADRLVAAFAGDVREHPAGFGWLLCGLDHLRGVGRIVVICGDPAHPEVRSMLDQVRGFDPMTSTVLVTPENAPVLTGLSPHLRELWQAAQAKGGVLAQVCSGRVCTASATTAAEFAKRMQS